MFLKKTSASGKFHFDEVYSCFQKSLRRGDLALSHEMVKEFRDYPNALKKRLIYNCCEDCPNLYLINAIFNTEPTIEKLAPFVKVICEHVKCREVIMAFRVACQREYVFDEFDFQNDDMFLMTRKLFTKLCLQKDVLQYFIDHVESLAPK